MKRFMTDANRYAMYLACAGPAYVNAASPIWERRGLFGRLVRVESKAIAPVDVVPSFPTSQAA